MTRSFRRATSLTVAATVIAAVLAACGGSPQAGSPGGSSGGNQGGISPATLSPCEGAVSCFHVSVTLSGDQSFKGNGSVPNRESCQTVLAQNATSNAGELTLGAVLTGGNGSVVTISVILHQYGGPGSYTQATNSVYVSILLGDSEFNPQFSSAATKIAADAAPDGSVRVTFTGLGGSSGSQSVTGTADFACQNA